MKYFSKNSVIPKQDDSESIISALSVAMATLTEQNDVATSSKIPNSVSPSIEIISPKKSITAGTDAALAGCGDDFEYADSLGTTGTSGTTGSKRKRVRHRKKKTNLTENDENQTNIANTPPVVLKSAVNVKRTNCTQLSKNNTHVR